MEDEADNCNNNNENGVCENGEAAEIEPKEERRQRPDFSKGKFRFFIQIYMTLF